jgi:L-ascorbate 6-phosphate lactonase
MRPHVVVPCINGRFGNMDAEQAARLVSRIKPKVAIASHFWMFVEHGGDPASFLENCAKHSPDVSAMVMKPGERFVFKV